MIENKIRKQSKKILITKCTLPLQKWKRALRKRGNVNAPSICSLVQSLKYIRIEKCKIDLFETFFIIHEDRHSVYRLVQSSFA